MGAQILTAEALEDARCFVALFVDGHGPEGFGTQFIGETVDRSPQFVHRIPCFIEASFREALCLLPLGLRHGERTLDEWTNHAVQGDANDPRR